MKKDFTQSAKTKKTAAIVKEIAEDKATNIKENRSKHFSALMRPSLYEGLKKVAFVNKISVNEILDSLLTEYLDKPENREAINRYDRAMSNL